jgi:hypothetical protein
MKIPARPYRNPLGDMQPDLEAVKRRGWRDQHVLVIAEDDGRLDVAERELIRQIGERLYGNQEVPHGRVDR